MSAEFLDEFTAVGAVLLKGACRRCMPDIEAVVKGLPIGEAGLRLQGIETLRELLAKERLGAIAASVIGLRARPVRAILFNKTPGSNWSLGWHQDRTIAVRDKRETTGFGPWTVKRGLNHVEPPFELLSRMVTLRIHLDDVRMNNAPLLIAPGSHLLGRIPVTEIDPIVRRLGTRACLAQAGDVWLYSTSILHASRAAAEPKSRRVLQVDYSGEDLPGRLEWLGV